MSQKARLNLLLIFVSIPFFAIAIRLSYLQIFQGSRLESLASQETERSVLKPLLRGRILDRNGAVLTESIPSWSCFADKNQLTQPNRASEALSKLLGMPPEAIRSRLKGRSKFVWLKKGLGLETAHAVAALKLKGIGLQQQERRAYPNGDMTRSLLGAVGAEGHGLSGLEYLYDQELQSPVLRFELLRDGAGRSIFQEGDMSPDPPKRLVLTIERNFQYFAEAALKEAVDKTQARSGMVIAQDPSTGEILVAASVPAAPLKNPVIQDTFEPGSTFKAVMALAAIAEGLVRPTETFDCEHGTWEMAPHAVIHDHEPEGTLTFTDIIAKSSNIGMAKISERVGAHRFYRVARGFGFGSRSGLSYPGEAAGLLKPPRSLDRFHLAQVSFGQGVGVTALQLITAYSAIANGGLLMEPALVRGIQDETGRWFKTRKPVTVRRVASPEAVRTLVKMLETAVGTGTGRAAQVPGYRVAGKTGTAQKIDPETGKYSKSLYVSSFIGFFPLENPKITLLILLDEPRRGYYGSDVAAPVFSRLAKEMLARLGVPSDRPEGKVASAEAQSVSR